MMKSRWVKGKLLGSGAISIVILLATMGPGGSVWAYSQINPDFNHVIVSETLPTAALEEDQEGAARASQPPIIKRQWALGTVIVGILAVLLRLSGSNSGWHSVPFMRHLVGQTRLKMTNQYCADRVINRSHAERQRSAAINSKSVSKFLLMMAGIGCVAFAGLGAYGFGEFAGFVLAAGLFAVSCVGIFQLKMKALKQPIRVSTWNW